MDHLNNFKQEMIEKNCERGIHTGRLNNKMLLKLKFIDFCKY